MMEESKAKTEGGKSANSLSHQDLAFGDSILKGLRIPVPHLYPKCILASLLSSIVYCPDYDHVASYLSS